MVPLVREFVASDGEAIAGWCCAFLAALSFGLALRRWWRKFVEGRRASDVARLRAERDALRLRVRALEREIVDRG